MKYEEIPNTDKEKYKEIQNTDKEKYRNTDLGVVERYTWKYRISRTEKYKEKHENTEYSWGEIQRNTWKY